MLFQKQVTFTHAVSSSSLAGISLMMTGEILRDLAALGSLCVSIVAMAPAVRAWTLKAVAWVRAKLQK